MEFSRGLMEESTKEIGKMENNTEKDFILEATGKLKKELGIKERKKNGSMRDDLSLLTLNIFL